MRVVWGAIAVFCVEVLVLIEFGRLLGALETLALLLLTSVLGAALLRAEGVAFIARLGDAVRRSGSVDLPPGPIADAAPAFLAGALFLAPGFLTDFAAVACLLPPVNGAVRRRVRRWIEERKHAAMAREAHFEFDIEEEIRDPEEGRGPSSGRLRMPRRLP